MTNDELEYQLAAVLDDLAHEFGDSLVADEITTVGRRHYERLRGQARIDDFIPLLVHRFARAELSAAARGDLPRAA
jgi:hypothetical protein